MIVPATRAYHAWQRRSWGERWLLLEAFLGLGLARLLVLTLPFQWIMAVCQLHRQPQAVMPLPSAATDTAVQQIQHAIGAASRATPWQSNCLAQALVAHRLLQRRRLGSMLYLGVAKAGDQPLAAHAWLCCGEKFVTGEPGWQRFTVIAIFGAGTSEA